MTLDFFLKTYDFNEFEIKNIIIEDYILRIEVVMETHLDYIANGYRPELDVKTKRVFVFQEANIKTLSFKKPFKVDIMSYNSENLILNICDNNIIIKNKEVQIQLL